jgi:TPP-dependent pyruvate/acetoin dehydrogenase alpha subunit
MKEDDNVCEALRELMKPEFDEALDKAVNEAVDKAVNEAVDKAVKEAKKEEASTIFDIWAQLKDGIQKERLIEQGYDKQIVEKAYRMLYQ